MRRYIFSLIATLTASVAFCQTPDADYYTYPLLDVKGYYSANFGEMRPNHFHSGVDFKTDGVQGKSVVAVADGYVARILQSPSGYGLALYVNHPNGTTSVYGHLSRFRKDIADFAWEERHRLKRSRIDIECKEGQFPVKKGEEIAKSGNTGSSFGPHLHFELRDTKTQKTLNIISLGIISPKDKIAPLFMRLHYFEVDTINNVPIHSSRATYSLSKGEENTYSTSQKAPIKVGRKGYFVVETSDRKDECANTYGVYNIKLQLDGETIFEYKNDGFTFDLSRYCNAVSYYPIQRNSRNEVMRLAHLQGCPTDFYPTLKNGGIITTQSGEKRKIKIIATDDCQNTSTLEFEILGKSDAESFKATLKEDAKIAHYDKPSAHKIDDTASVILPRGVLYESIALKAEKSSVAPQSNSVKILSPAYTIHHDDTPLQSSIGIIFKQKVSKELQPYTTMAGVNSSGGVYYIGGKYRFGRLIGRTSSFGSFCLVADLTPPTISASFNEGADCRGKDRIYLRINDNFSGVAHYDVYIDDKWVAVDYSRGRAWINLRAEDIKGNKEHSIKVTAVDSCGNRTSWESSFIW